MMTRAWRRSRRARLAAVLTGALLLAGCGGGGGPSGTGAGPPMTPAAPEPAASSTTTTKPPGSSVAARPAAGLTAGEGVVRFRQPGLPVQGWPLFHAETDDERLLGRKGQYTSKVSFSDERLSSGGGTDAS